MKRCVKKVCDCLKPMDVFRCLKINVVSLDIYKQEASEVHMFGDKKMSQEDFKKIDKHIEDNYINKYIHK